MAGRHRARRSEDFKVRRWLQMGAASAGMGAALWGMSLVGPQIDVAVADDSGSSASSSDSSSSKSDAGPKKSYATKRGDSARGASERDTDSSSDHKDSDKGSDSKDNTTDSDGNDDTDGSDRKDTATTTDTDDADDTEGNDSDDADSDDADTQTSPVEESSAKYQNRDRARADSWTAAPQTPTANLVPGPSTTEPTVAENDSPVTVAAEPSDGDPWGMEQVANEEHPWQGNTADIITGTTANLQFLIDSLPVPPELRDALTGTLWTLRRSLFNLAPTMDEEYQVTSGLGTILGQAKATDAEGDQIAYRIVRGPEYGSLDLNDDGTFTYTPDEDFDGVDTFVIEATDLGFHLNLLDPFRGAGASASMLVNQNAIDFDFTYDDPEGYFDDDAKEALYQSAKRLSVYFIVKQKTVLTYTVNSYYADDGLLASAGSATVSDDPGFWGSIVQEKLLTGIDHNGEEADGEINWNWDNNWGYYPTVESDQYDFTSTVMHELLHSFGWVAAFSYPGDTEQTTWYTYSQFVTTRNGDSPIDPNTYEWDPFYDRYLTGFDGGMYFFGENAMAAYNGRPVPLYTPDEWEGGSSISHLDDGVFSGPNHVMMDHAALSTGPDNISLSPVELGILKDLGYTVVPSPWFAYPVYGSAPDEEEDL